MDTDSFTFFCSKKNIIRYGEIDWTKTPKFILFSNFGVLVQSILYLLFSVQKKILLDMERLTELKRQNLFYFPILAF